MRLDLSDIIEIPGGVVPFECELDPEALLSPSVARFVSAPRAVGEVRNGAGALTLRAVLTAPMICACDRCGAEFDLSKTLEVEAYLADKLEDEENADIFLLDGDYVNLSEVLETCFILDMEAKFLCADDCAGLCEDCGANLNNGPCGCKKEIDPRLAALGQLLDTEE